MFGDFRFVDYRNKKTLPIPYDLVYILLDNHRIITGWYIRGTQWYSFRSKDFIVKGWKPKMGRIK